MCLILVNLATFLFLETRYAWINISASAVGVAVMMVIYTKMGFVRLLGIGHILWIPMIAYFLTDLPYKAANALLLGCVAYRLQFGFADYRHSRRCPVFSRRTITPLQVVVLPTAQSAV